MTKTTKYRLFKKIFNHSPPKNNKIEKMLKRTPINQYYPSRNSYNCCSIKQSEVSSRIIFLLRISSLSDFSDNEDLLTAKEQAILRNAEVNECRELQYS